MFVFKVKFFVVVDSCVVVDGFSVVFRDVRILFVVFVECNMGVNCCGVSLL